MHPALQRMLVQEVRVQPITGRDDYGDPAYGPERRIRARVEPTTKIVIVGDGQAFQAAHRIIAVEGIAPEDRVWLPGATEPSTAKSVLKIPEPFSSRIDHIEVYL